MAQTVKKPLCSVADPGSVPRWEDLLEKGNGHPPSKVLCLENPWTEELWRVVQSMGSQVSDMTEQVYLDFKYFIYQEEEES